MKNPVGCEGCNSLALLLARLPLGATLIFAGVKKFQLPGGVSEFVRDYGSRVPSYMPEQFGPYYLQAVPYAEVILGALLVVGLLTRVSGLLSAAMLVSFAMAVTGFVNTTGSGPLVQSPVVYAALALIALLAGPGKISLDGLFFGRRAGRSRARD